MHARDARFSAGSARSHSAPTSIRGCFASPRLTSAFYRLWTGREALIKLAVELGSPAALTPWSPTATLSEAPAPAAGWYHTEIRPGVALSLVWESDGGPVRVEFVDAAPHRIIRGLNQRDHVVSIARHSSAR